MTDQQLIHKANGIKRIKQAIKNCDLPVSVVGTVFTPRIRFKHFMIEPLKKAILNSKYANMYNDVFNQGITDFYKTAELLKKPQTKCKHEYIMPEDTFELPYCKHCYKGA
jgi:hypothetical protein